MYQIRFESGRMVRLRVPGELADRTMVALVRVIEIEREITKELGSVVIEGPYKEWILE